MSTGTNLLLLDQPLSSPRERGKPTHHGKSRHRSTTKGHGRSSRSRSRERLPDRPISQHSNDRFGRYNDKRNFKANGFSSSETRERSSYSNDNTKISEYYVAHQEKDEKLGDLKDDPRGDDPTKRITTKASSRGNGRNTESFDPISTLVRPDLRIHVGSNRAKTINIPLKNDDVVIVPELFGSADDWSLYYKLVEEIRSLQTAGVSGSEWIPWHEGAHLISKNPKGASTMDEIIDKLCEYFKIRKESIGTRFNWYRDSSDWKPFHHDSAAFNPRRAKNQNITVGVSFGATRELAFVRASPLEDGSKVRLYFPQTNNGVFSFGRDANILWKHGINALKPEEQNGKGRISIILWGLAQDIQEEDGSPPLLGIDGKGPHAGHYHRRDHHRHHHHRDHHHHHGRHRNRNN